MCTQTLCTLHAADVTWRPKVKALALARPLIARPRPWWFLTSRYPFIPNIEVWFAYFCRLLFANRRRKTGQNPPCTCTPRSPTPLLDRVVHSSHYYRNNILLHIPNQHTCSRHVNRLGNVWNIAERKGGWRFWSHLWERDYSYPQSIRDDLVLIKIQKEETN